MYGCVQVKIVYTRTHMCMLYDYLGDLDVMLLLSNKIFSLKLVCVRAIPSQTNCTAVAATATPTTGKKLTARLSKHEPVIKLLKSVNRNQCKWRQPRNTADRFRNGFYGSWNGIFLVSNYYIRSVSG